MFITNLANPTGTFTTGDELASLLHDALPPNVVLARGITPTPKPCTDPTFTDGLELAAGPRTSSATHTFSANRTRPSGAAASAGLRSRADRRRHRSSIRPPFNVSIPALAAAVASMADEDFQALSLAHVEQWRPWLTQQLGGLGLASPLPRQLHPVRAPEELPGRSPPKAEMFLASRGLIVRGVANYGLPAHLRITIGLEEHNRALVEALAEFLER